MDLQGHVGYHRDGRDHRHGPVCPLLDPEVRTVENWTDILDATVRSESDLSEAPVTVFTQVGISAAVGIVKFVVLTSALSS